jgi:hypothetical protein
VGKENRAVKSSSHGVTGLPWQDPGLAVPELSDGSSGQAFRASLLCACPGELLHVALFHHVEQQKGSLSLFFFLFLSLSIKHTKSSMLVISKV